MHPKLFTKQDNVKYDHLSSKSTNNLRNANSPSNHQVRESMVMSDTIKKQKPSLAHLTTTCLQNI